mgnify:CR=1 FL=1
MKRIGWFIGCLSLLFCSSASAENLLLDSGSEGDAAGWPAVKGGRILLVQAWILTVQMKQCLYPILHMFVFRIIQQEPVQFALLAPLTLLRE